MKTRSVLLLLLLPFSIFAHQADSTVRALLLSDVKDTLRVNALLDAGYAYEQSDPDSALLIYKKAIEISNDLEYASGAARGNHYAGIVCSEYGDYTQAIQFYNRAIEEYRKSKNELGEAKVLINIGNVYFFKGMFKQSLTNQLGALTLLERHPENSVMAQLYTNLGSVYSSIKEVDKSIFYHTKSRQVAAAVGDSIGISKADINLGVTYVAIGALDSARRYFTESLAIAEKFNSVSEQYFSLNNLATIAEQSNNYDEALRLAKLAQVKAAETEDPVKISSASIMLGVSYLNIKQYDVALHHLKSAIELSRVHGLLDNLAVAYAAVTEIHEKMGHYKEAYESFKLANTYSDSLVNMENFKEIGRIEGKYDLEAQLREKQIAEEKAALVAQEARERRDRIQYFLIAIAVLAVFVILKLIRNFNISFKTSQVITLIAVLFFFEFLLIFLDPYVERISGSVPVYKLALNLCLALLIFPVHEWLLRLLSERKTTNPAVES